MGGKNAKRSHLMRQEGDPKTRNKTSRLLPGRSAAGWRFAPPPPPLHGVPRLSVRSVSRLSVGALSGQFFSQAVDGLVVGQDGADVLLKQRREPQTHTVDLETQQSCTDSAVTQRHTFYFMCSSKHENEQGLCVCVCVSHPRLLTGRVSFGIAENEPDIFAELNGRLVLSFC